MEITPFSIGNAHIEKIAHDCEYTTFRDGGYSIALDNTRVSIFFLQIPCLAIVVPFFNQPIAKFTPRHMPIFFRTAFDATWDVSTPLFSNGINYRFGN